VAAWANKSLIATGSINNKEVIIDGIIRSITKPF
jgi:hypothetical protein